MVRLMSFLMVLLLGSGMAAADQVTITGGTVYVTRNDCAVLMQHRPQADITYQPGVDVHGKYVPPADLPGTDYSLRLPDRVQFEVLANPMTFGPGATGQGTGLPAGRYANTAMPVAHLDVDLKTGQVAFNGRPLSGAQDKTLMEACRKAGLR